MTLQEMQKELKNGIISFWNSTVRNGSSQTRRPSLWRNKPRPSGKGKDFRSPERPPFISAWEKAGRWGWTSWQRNSGLARTSPDR